MMNKFSTAFAAAALATLPMMASAVTTTQSHNVSVNTAPSYSYSVPTSEDGVIFEFTALDDFIIDTFSLNANGSNGGVDVSAATYQVSVTNPVPVNFSTVFSAGGQGQGFAFVSGATFMAGDVFTVSFDESSPRPMSFTVGFVTTAVADVPVPAAGLLLLSALGGAAALRRRKKAATQA